MENGLTKNLPDLIELAIRDAEGLDRDMYYPFSSVFHSSNYPEHGFCNFCLSGAVMAGTLNRPYNEDHYPSRVYNGRKHNAAQLNALDAVRTGNYISAAEWLGYELTNDEISELKLLPAPKEPFFDGWKEFDEHIESLKEISKQIRGILK